MIKEQIGSLKNALDILSSLGGDEKAAYESTKDLKIKFFANKEKYETSTEAVIRTITYSDEIEKIKAWYFRLKKI